MAVEHAPSTMPTALATFVESERRRADVAGTAIVAFDRGGVRFDGYLGYANLAAGERVTAATLFRAASISKLFTASLVLQEVDASRIALDEPVNRHLDARTQIRDAKGRPTSAVTVRHLLTTPPASPWKGLKYGNVVMQHLANGVRLPETLDDAIAGQRTIRDPGERIVYANGGFALLGHLVARLNRQPFEHLYKSACPRRLRCTSRRSTPSRACRVSLCRTAIRSAAPGESRLQLW
jgi:CubicO group peptidase (beta-lactamase class C family)